MRDFSIRRTGMDEIGVSGEGSGSHQDFFVLAIRAHQQERRLRT
jgi:hypothetical protein